MIRFTCPRCQHVLERQESAAGSKIDCPGCGVRLQVPLPPKKAVLGNLTVEDSAAPAGAPAPVRSVPAAALPQIQVRTIDGRPHVCWRCLYCQTELASLTNQVGHAVQCPTCNQQVKVPEPPPPAAVGSPYIILSPAEPAERGRPEPEPVPLRRPRPSRPRRADDRDLDRIVHEGDTDAHTLARQATASLVCSLIGLGLPVFLFFIIVAITADRPRSRDLASGLVVLLILATVGSFVLNLLGVIFGARGMNQANIYNRGVGIAGMVCGIVGLVFSSICGLAACGGFMSATEPMWRL